VKIPKAETQRQYRESRIKQAKYRAMQMASWSFRGSRRAAACVPLQASVKSLWRKISAADYGAAVACGCLGENSGCQKST